MRLTLIHRRRKTAAKPKKAKTKRRIVHRRRKPAARGAPSPHGATTAKGRKAPHPKPRTVAA